MAEVCSEHSPFKSNYGGGWNTAAQYIAEAMVARIARYRGKTLPMKFWNRPEWERTYLLQLRYANSLLKLYSLKAIIKALRTPEGKKVYSLAAKWLDPLIKQEEVILQRQQKTLEDKLKNNENNRIDNSGHGGSDDYKVEKPRESFTTNKSNLTKLRELDG